MQTLKFFMHSVLGVTFEARNFGIIKLLLGPTRMSALVLTIQAPSSIVTHKKREAPEAMSLMVIHDISSLQGALYL